MDSGRRQETQNVEQLVPPSVLAAAAGRPDLLTEVVGYGGRRFVGQELAPCDG